MEKTEGQNKAKFDLMGLFSRGVDSLLIVDISTELKLLEVKLKGQVTLNALKITELPAEKKEEFILENLKNFIRENNIRHKNAVLSPPLDSLVIKRIQLPAVPESELPEAIKWKIKDEVPFDLSKAVFGYQIINRIEKPDGAKLLDLKCVAAQGKEVKKEVLFLKQAGLNCLAVVPVTFGYANLAQRFLKEEKEKTVSILLLSQDKCYFVIYKENKFNFYRELPVSLNKLKESLSGMLVSDKGKVQLSADEIDEILFKHGIPTGDFVYKDKLSASQIMAMLRPGLERLAQEIKRSFTYYYSQFQGSEVKKMFFLDQALSIPNLDSFLSKELSLSVSSISVADKIKLAPNINAQDLSRAYASLGLAFDYEKNINLLPPEFKTEKIEVVQKISLRWVFIIAFLLFLVSYIFSLAGLSAYQKRLGAAKVQLGVLSQIKEMKAKIDALRAAIKKVKDSEIRAGDILEKLSVITPPELFFETLDIDSGSRSGTISGLIKTKGQDPDAILSRFIDAMERSAYFKNVKVASVEKAGQDYNSTRFKIIFNL